MRHFLIVLTILFSTSAFGQNAEDSVKATINALFTAMRNADGEGVKNTFASDAVLQTISRDKKGEPLVITDTVAAFADFINTVKKDSADERISFGTIQTDGPLAIAWTPYEFYYNGKFSHCGVNSFQLIRAYGVWKIQYLIDTRRKNCK